MRQRRRKHSGHAALLKARLYALWKRFSRLPEEGEVSDEPIDFSAPSVPYYMGLSEKFNLARIVLYLLLFVFLVVTVIGNRHLITYENLYYLVKDVGAASLTAQSSADHLSYPISGTTADFALYRGGLTVVGNQEITVLSGSGKQTLSANVSYAEPCVRAGERHFLTFSRGENNYSVYNSFVCIRQESTEYPIYQAVMARDGAFAVLTRSMDYHSEVIFYNEDLNKVAHLHLGGYVTAMDITPDGKRLAVLSLSLEDSGYTTKLTILERGNSTEPKKEVLMEHTTVLSASFLSDDTLAVIAEDRLMLLRTDGSVRAEIPLGNRVPLMTASDSGYLALLFASEDRLSDGELKVFDKNGKMVYNISIPSVGSVLELLLSGQDVYVRTNDRILHITDKGNRIAAYGIHRDTLALLLDDSGRLLACHPAYAERIEASDFTALP